MEFKVGCLPKQNQKKRGAPAKRSLWKSIKPAVVACNFAVARPLGSLCLWFCPSSFCWEVISCPGRNLSKSFANCPECTMWMRCSHNTLANKIIIWNNHHVTCFFKPSCLPCWLQMMNNPAMMQQAREHSGDTRETAWDRKSCFSML